MQPQFVEGNVRTKSLTDIWNNPDGFAYNRKFTRQTATGECRECRYLPVCRGGCTTTSVSASGDRANNPYCIYRMEKKQGITPVDSEVITTLLDRMAAAESEMKGHAAG
jgi:radical SAM protein with 4Fe4S-binding SPASM domain